MKFLSPSFKNGLWLCLLIACSGAVLDVGLSFLLLPMGLTSLWNLLPTFATDALVVTLVATLIYLAVGLAREFKGERQALSFGAFTGALVVGFALASTANRMLTRRLDPFPVSLVILGLVLPFVFAFTITVIFRLLREKAIPVAAGCLLVLASFLFTFWALAYHAPSSFSFIGLTALAFQITVFGFILYVGRVWERVLRFTRVFTVGILISLIPLTLLVLRHPIRSGENDLASELTGHSVRKVIVICIDTLRADHLSCMGMKLIETPEMDALANDGILFRRAVSSAPWTRPSVTSLMTGVPSAAHSVTTAQHRLPDGLPTLAEGFRNRGYLTAMIGDNLNLMPAAGFSRGFDEYNFFPRYRDELGWSLGAHALRRTFLERLLADPTTTDLITLTERWLSANRDNDFFLWLHLFTPHLPYSPPRHFIPDAGYDEYVGYMYDPYLEDNKKFPPRIMPPVSTREWIQKLYASEVRQADEALGRVTKALRDLNIYSDTLVILTSDHGEELWQHGKLGHGHSLYDELLHVPLIIKLPESAHAQSVVHQSVPSMAIFQTLNDLCELGLPTPYPFATSFAPLWQNPDALPPTFPIISQSITRPPDPDQRSVTLDLLKFVVDARNAAPAVYDLQQDPDEEHAAPAENSSRWDEIQTILKIHDDSCAAIRAAVGEATEFTLPEEQTEGLRALGYLE